MNTELGVRADTLNDLMISFLANRAYDFSANWYFPCLGGAAGFLRFQRREVFWRRFMEDAWRTRGLFEDFELGRCITFS